MGVIVVRDGQITDIIEKPQQFVGNLSTIGMYYFRTSGALFSAIDRVLAAPPKLGGRVLHRRRDQADDRRRRDPHPYVVASGKIPGRSRRRCTPIAGSSTAPVGRPNRARASPSCRRCTSPTTPPWPRPSIGPYVSIESGCRVERSVLTDCILDEGATVRDGVLARSLLGPPRKVEGSPLSLNVGDDSASPRRTLSRFRRSEPSATEWNQTVVLSAAQDDRGAAGTS
jgi:glucose-1-phosphate thymidylyltransferase